MKIPVLCQACREGRAGGVVRHDIGLKGNDSKRGLGQREGDNLKWPQRKFWLEKKRYCLCKYTLSISVLYLLT